MANVDRLRRTVMFAAGNNAALVRDATIYGADSVIYDLEDSVSIHEKDSARQLVFHALTRLPREGSEVGVRINHISTPWGRDDLEKILPARPDYIRLPKGETGEEIRELDRVITAAEERNKFEPGSISIMVSLESPKGLRNALEIATASPRMIAIAIGGEDFVTSMRTEKSRGNPITAGRELFVPRGLLVLAAKEAGIQAIDSVFSDLRDPETLRIEAQLIKEMGFDGKSCVNPRQIDIIHEVFTPTAKDIAYALRVLDVYDEAMRNKSGVIALDGKMIDLPMVTRANRVLSLARAAGADR